MLDDPLQPDLGVGVSHIKRWLFQHFRTTILGLSWLLCRWHHTNEVVVTCPNINLGSISTTLDGGKGLPSRCLYDIRIDASVLQFLIVSCKQAGHVCRVLLPVFGSLLCSCVVFRSEHNLINAAVNLVGGSHSYICQQCLKDGRREDEYTITSIIGA
jgi:hypothetical protein